MADSPVFFEHVWKKFRTGQRHDSLRDLVPDLIQSAFRPRPTSELQQQEFWALEDVSFEVTPGTALGIIGPNGAGKSTILKVLTRILKPNRGRSVVRGRVGALIEVAAGFHPDLTGRENIFLQGAVMGMKRHEVLQRFDEIVEFAGVGPFVNTQIKRYSSGMNARLGFSVAAHLSPEVLIIDEVLSVGDMAFQERCVNRMRQFKREGVTIVFVSHNLQAVTELCDQALYLKRRPMAFGPTPAVIEQYVKDAFTPSHDAQSTSELQIRAVQLVDAAGSPVSAAVAPGAALRCRVEFAASSRIDGIGFAFRLVRSTDQLLVYDGQFSQQELGLTVEPGSEFSIEFDFAVHLTRGQYYVEVVAGHTATQRYLARLTPAAHLSVAESRTWGGVANLDVRPTVRALSRSEPAKV